MSVISCQGADNICRDRIKVKPILFRSDLFEEPFRK